MCVRVILPQALLEHKHTSGSAALREAAAGGGGERSHDVSRDTEESPMGASTIAYACSAVQGFFRSIALSVESSLQDTLR